MRNLCFAFAIAFGSTGPALADCAFGGPCGDGSPYGTWNERWNGRGDEGDHRGGFGDDDSGRRDYNYGDNIRSFGSNRRDDDE